MGQRGNNSPDKLFYEPDLPICNNQIQDMGKKTIYRYRLMSILIIDKREVIVTTTTEVAVYILELTFEELQVIKAMAGRVCGEGPTRNIVDRIHKSMPKEIVGTNYDLFSGMLKVV